MIFLAQYTPLICRHKNNHKMPTNFLANFCVCFAGKEGNFGLHFLCWHFFCKKCLSFHLQFWSITNQNLLKIFAPSDKIHKRKVQLFWIVCIGDCRVLWQKCKQKHRCYVGLEIENLPVNIIPVNLPNLGKKW